MPKYSKRRSYRKPSAKKVAYKALALAKQNMPVIKHHDVVISTSPSSSGSITILSSVQEGTTEHQRSSEETRLLSVRISAYCSATSDAEYSTQLRFILFRDVRIGIPTVGGNNNAVLEAANTYSHVRQDNKRRYIILLDRRSQIQFGHSNENYLWKDYINLKKVKASYNGVGSADTTEGHLYMLIICNDPVNEPVLRISSRVYFTSA